MPCALCGMLMGDARSAKDTQLLAGDEKETDISSWFIL